MRDEILRTAAELSLQWLSALDEPPVFPESGKSEWKNGLDLPLGEEGVEPREVLDDLARSATPGLVKSAGGRYFGFVTGGAFPVAVAADWLTAAWDQNSFSYASSPAVGVIEATVAGWLLDLLDLPRHSTTAFVTGCQMAHVTAFAAARHRLLAERSWDVAADGLYGAPEIKVVAGALRHATVDRALRLLGMGTAGIRSVGVDPEGRMLPDQLAATLDDLQGQPVIVVAQAGEVNTGSFDPLAEIAGLARGAGAWLHVDGAFGIWARTSPSLRHHVEGLEQADSWAFDAHKWLNVPYDSGVVVVADPEAHHAAMSYSGPYLLASEGDRDASDWTPDASRRGRGIAIYATLRALGRSGVRELIDQSCHQARVFADGIAGLGLEVLNTVELNQVLFRAGTDDETDELLTRIQASGETWMGGTTWAGRRAIRLSVSSWATTPDDVARTLEVIRRAME